MWLREFVWDLYPLTNELIYNSYDAVAFRWSPTATRHTSHAAHHFKKENLFL